MSIMQCFTLYEQRSIESRFSKGDLNHPSKAFVNFMINDQTSTEQKNCTRKEGYTSNDMH